MKLCCNCGKPLKNGNRRCGACADYKLRTGTERPVKWQPLPPLPPRVELYRRGKCITTVYADDPDANEVYAVRLDQAERRRVPVEAIVPVLRPARE